MTLGDPRIKIIQNDTNLGPGISRDRAISIASGEWIAFLDADDVMVPRRFETLLQLALKTDSDVVFDDLLLCHHTPFGMTPWKCLHGATNFGSRGGPSRVGVEEYLTSERLLIKPIVRRRVITSHGIQHSDKRFAEDAEFFLLLYLAGAKFLYVPEPLYHYRIMPGSLTARVRNHSAMRTCLAACSEWEGWSASARQAFAIKVEQLRIMEVMYEIVGHAASGRIDLAMQQAILHPSAVLGLLKKSRHRLGYELHRRLLKGEKRDHLQI